MKTILLFLIITTTCLAQISDGITKRYRVIYDTSSHAFVDSVKDYNGTITYPSFKGNHIVISSDSINGLYQELDTLIQFKKNINDYPNIGTLVYKDDLYNYNGIIVCVRQSHLITNYSPLITPALFYIYREQTGDTLQWIVGESVKKNDLRYFNDILYRCLQSHITQESWPPNFATSLWNEVSAEECPTWVQPTGAHDAYNIGDCVTFNGKEYTSLINANVWSPDVYPMGWQER